MTPPPGPLASGKHPAVQMENRPVVIKDYVITQWYTKVHKGTQWYTKVHKGTQRYTKVHKGSQRYTKGCQLLPVVTMMLESD